jgi:hypothetical protein
MRASHLPTMAATKLKMSEKSAKEIINPVLRELKFLQK